jgi:hypothetical protein
LEYFDNIVYQSNNKETTSTEEDMIELEKEHKKIEQYYKHLHP